MSPRSGRTQFDPFSTGVNFKRREARAEAVADQ